MKDLLEKAIKPQLNKHFWYSPPPAWILLLNKALTLKELRLIKSQEWTKRLKELDELFDQNNTKEAFKLAK
jgi:ABC-type Zn2+ transport system substrate-binding protein/surface adhesin